MVLGALAFAIPWILCLLTATTEPRGHGDWPKMAFIGKVWGIPHPTGFPLYLMLDGIASHIPIGTLMFRAAFINATAVAVAMHLLYRMGRLLKFGPFLALSVALLAATGRDIWLQGSIPDVYGLHILLIVATVWALLKWDRGDDIRWMWAATWFFILSTANHPATLFAFPGLIIFVLVRSPRVLLSYKTWLHVLGAVLVVIALYGYVLVRSGQPQLFNEGLWDGPIGGDPERFWSYLVASDFHRMWRLNHAETLRNWRLLLEGGGAVMGRYGWFAVIAGIVSVCILSWRQALLLVLVPLVSALAVFIYQTSEPSSWLAVSYVFATLFVGLAVYFVSTLPDRLLRRTDSGHVRRPAGPLLVAAGCVVLLLVAASHVPVHFSMYNLSGPSEDSRSARRMVAAIESPALILTHNYPVGMRIFYCLYADDSRPEMWPRYIAVLERIDLSASKYPISVKWPYDQDLVRQALDDGIHVYVAAAAIDDAHKRFWMKAVATGSEQPEMFELLKGPEPDAIAPERDSP